MGSGVVEDEFIAQVTSKEPLQMKIQESGPYSRLRDGDFIVLQDQTAQFQQDMRDNTHTYLEGRVAQSKPALSGLRSLGVLDDALHTILPAPTTAAG